MPQQEERISLSATQIGSMMETIDPAVQPVGMARELRNIEFLDGKIRPRRGWERVFAARLPFTTCVNGKGGAWRDSGGRLHRVYFGDNSRIYHALGETPTAWTEVAQHWDVPFTWDATYRCSFASWRDDLFVAFWQPPEVAAPAAAGAQNLRIAGLSDQTDPLGLFHAFGVGIPEPATAPTLTAALVAGGDIPFGSYSYFYTFRDMNTLWESDRSPITTVDIVQPEPPDQKPVATAAAGGALAAGYTEWAVCFVEATLGYRSALSMPAQLNIVAPNQTCNLTNVRLCPDVPLPGPGWYREVYRRDAGGIYGLVGVIGDNTTQVFVDNGIAAGAAYDEGRVGVVLTTIDVYGAGGTPINGRDIVRRIYRQDPTAVPTATDPYVALTAGTSEIANNTDVTYTDILESPNGKTWSRSVAIPQCGVVAAGPDARLLWANDRINQLAAQIYLSKSDDEPESLAVDAEQSEELTYMAGTHDDPITAAEDARDGWIVGKRKAIHYVGRQCANCERILKNRGNMGPGTMQTLDSRVVFLTAEGPGQLNHMTGSDFAFCGPLYKGKFCLTRTWERVVKARLPYATSFHWPSAGLVGWAVQLCAEWPLDPPHNDTLIVWEEAGGDEGRVWLMDFPGVDCFMQIPAAGSGTDHIEAVFANGVVVRMFAGAHPDGTTGVLSGTVLTVSGEAVTVDPAALGGQDVVGSTLFVNGGVGTRMCRAVDPCESAKSLIVSQCGGRLTTAGALPIAPGSEFEIGMSSVKVGLPINAGNLQATKQYLTAHVRFD